MAGERCKSCGFLFGGVARVVGVCTHFFDVMLEGGVVLMEGEACDKLWFFIWWSCKGCEWVYMVL